MSTPDVRDLDGNPIGIGSQVIHEEDTGTVVDFYEDVAQTDDGRTVYDGRVLVAFDGAAMPNEDDFAMAPGDDGEGLVCRELRVA